VELLPWQEADVLGDEALFAALAARHPHLVGFTTYAWNAERTAYLVGRLAEAGIPSVLGGPEVAVDNPWLTAEIAPAPAVVGEGEAAFPRLLRAHPRLPTGLVVGPTPDLATVPSPYLSGILRPSSDKSVWLETLRGCPFRCDYCTYGKGGSRVRRFPRGWLAAHLAWARHEGAREVYLMDPSCNARSDWDEVLQTLEQANPDRALALHTELVADALRPADAARLARAGLRSCEVGLQSIDPGVLAGVGRTWQRDAWIRGTHALLDAGVEVAVGLIVGLPGDTLDGFAQSLEFVLTQVPRAGVQVFPLALLPGSRLRDRADELGLQALARPPYTVTRTPGMQPGDLAAAFRLFEDRTGLELDRAPLPRLAGPWTGGEDAPYLSGAHLDLPHGAATCDWVERLAPRAAHSPILWARGWHHQFPEQVRRLRRRLPHAALTIVVEDDWGWEPERLDPLLGQGRSRDPCPEQGCAAPGAPVHPRVIVLLDAGLQAPADWLARIRCRGEIIRSLAGAPGWEMHAATLAQDGEDVLVTGIVSVHGLEPLAARLGPDAAGVCFADPDAQRAWDGLLGLPATRAADHRISFP
jgi:hypothetical protein